jgi:serine/threonine protein phosphatase PrpC
MDWDDVILLSWKKFGWNMMIENLKEAYIHHRWVKIVALLGVLLCGMLLTLFSGGFPPWAWIFLLQVIPRLSGLWATQGAIILLPFAGLCLLSLSIVIMWVVLMVLAVKIVVHLWRDYTARQSFEDDLRAATLLAEQEQALSAHDTTANEDVPVLAPASQRRQTRPIQTRVPDPQPQAARQRTTLALAGMDVHAPAYVASAAGGDTHFPGLTYPTPMLRQAQHNEAPRANKPTNGQFVSPPLQNRPASMRERLSTIPAAAVEDRSQSRDDMATDQTPVERLSRDRETPRRYDQLSFDGLPLGDELEYEQPYDDDEVENDLPYDDEMEIDLWETHSNDLDSDVNLEQYDVINSQDERLQELEYQFSSHHSHPSEDSSEFDFDQQSLPVKREVSATAMFRLIVGSGIDPGLKRKDAPNEDSLFAIQGIRMTDEGSQPAGLFVIADGMGGHANGREASRTAVHAISDVIVPALLRDVSGNSAKEEKALFLDMLKDGVHQANLSLYRRNRDLAPNMMGTTLTAALQVGTTAYIANVGDSRTYLYRPSEGLSQITHDHSVVARLVEEGMITPEEIYTHPKRNQIYRCLGEHASVEIDAFVITLQADDILLLCSDGLWEMVHDDVLEEIIDGSSHSPSQISALLVQAALDHGGVDNISVIAVELTDSDHDLTD